MADPDRLYRFLDPGQIETLDRLKRDAEAAEPPPPKGVGLYGVSVSSVARRPAPSASWAEATANFDVQKTGQSPTHYTVVLPRPIDQDVVDLFNQVFHW
jgi:hypothetical protein